jgi:hypothetical protein
MRIHTAYDEEKEYVVASPARSLLRLRLPAANSARIREFQTLRLPELLIAGYRQSFMLARCIRRLYREGVEAMGEAATGSRSPTEAARRIENCVEAAEELHERWRPVATSVDRFFLSTMIREEGYLEYMAQMFGTMYSNTETETILADLTDLATSLEPKVPNPQVFALLTDLYERYGRIAVEAVADVALDIPVKLGPGANPVKSYKPVERLETSASELNDIGDVSAHSSLEIMETLRNRIGDTATPPPQPATPLLSVRINEANPTRFPTMEIDQVPISEAAMAQTMVREFQQGGFGGVVYERSRGTDRLVNPFIATEESGGNSYKTYWQRAYVGTELLDTIRERTDPEIGLECPLCKVSIGKCAGDTCGSRAFLDPIRAIASPLIRGTNQ